MAHKIPLTCFTFFSLLNLFRVQLLAIGSVLPSSMSPGSWPWVWSSISCHRELHDGGNGKMRDVNVWANQKLKGAWKPHDWAVPFDLFACGWLRSLWVFLRMAVAVSPSDDNGNGVYVLLRSVVSTFLWVFGS